MEAPERDIIRIDGASDAQGSCQSAAAERRTSKFGLFKVLYLAASLVGCGEQGAFGRPSTIGLQGADAAPAFIRVYGTSGWHS